MDFREATIDLGGKAATAPGAGGSGGGAIGPGARGGNGGPGGHLSEFTVTGAQVLGEIPIEVGHGGRAGWLAYPAKPEGTHALEPSSHPAVAAKRIRLSQRVSRRSSRPLSLQPCLPIISRSTTDSATSVVLVGVHTTSQIFPPPSAVRFASGSTCLGPMPSLGHKFPRSDRRASHTYQDNDVQRDELLDYRSGRTRRVRPGIVYVFPYRHPSRGRSPRTQCLV
jgi:hypothetical protein